MAQHQEEADYVSQRRTSLEATRLSCSPGPPSLMYFPSCYRCFIILEEGLLVCRLFTGLALQLVPVVSIQVSVEVPSIQQIFPLSVPMESPRKRRLNVGPWKKPGSSFFY